MNCWKEALETVLIQEQEGASHRSSFIEDFLQMMSDKRFALLKFHQEELSEISASSDLDVLIQEKDLIAIEKFIKENKTIIKIKVHHKSFMTTMELFFKDQSFVSLDLIHSLQRKLYKLLDENTLLEKVIHKNENIRVLSPIHDFEFTFLFYQLNKADFPMKYFYVFSKLSMSRRKELTSYINQKYDLNQENIESLMDYTPHIFKKIMKKLSQQTVNQGLPKVYRLRSYILDTLVDLKKKRGFIVTFTGVDGAGKSTIISLVSTKLSEKYRKKVVLLRHRPSILPILSSYTHGKKEAEIRTLEKNPRSGNNTQFLSSLLRFLYYLTDYVVGQFYVYVRYVLRGKIVLYDRYYYDFVCDAKRSNIVLPSWITKTFFALICKPKINFFLYADPKVILKRKQELDKQTIIELTNSYRTLFLTYNKKYKRSHYTQIENIDCQKTIDKIMGKVTELI